MKTYVGTKIIRAEEMDRETFFKKNKNENLGTNVPNEHGYLVQYPDGYVSWSPKAIFEEAYRLISVNEHSLISDVDLKRETKE